MPPSIHPRCNCPAARYVSVSDVEYVLTYYMCLKVLRYSGPYLHTYEYVEYLTSSKYVGVLNRVSTITIIYLFTYYSNYIYPLGLTY